MLRDLFSLFPAHAGVIPEDMFPSVALHTFPRTCGGDPNQLHENQLRIIFSPHMRG